VIGWLDANLITMVDGVAFGVLLFTIALGLSLVFGVLDVLNLAHGALYLGGAYIAVSVVTGQASLVSFVLAALVAVALGGAAGAGLALITRPLASRGHLDQALLTLGIAFVVVELYSGTTATTSARYPRRRGWRRASR
jgi:branched-chain amino acid transport system permease protein